MHMDRSCLSILAFFLFVGVTGGSHADAAHLSPQLYWSTALPNTTMPAAIRERLRYSQGVLDSKVPAVVNVGGGGVHVGAGARGSVDVNVTVNPIFYPTPFTYLYAATDDQLRYDPNVALFFLREDLHPGATMTLHFTTTPTVSVPRFLPRWEADTTPFSSSELPAILAHFSVQPGSTKAGVMSQTLEECEASMALDGEDKLCATSLESMVDFATSRLGTNDVVAVSTVVDKESTAKQKYTIISSTAITSTSSSEAVAAVACHSLPYEYAVFYCHTTGRTTAYVVKMVGEDGARAEAVAVCHADTSRWNPKHLAFRVLGVKAGGAPVCHFLPRDHVVWSSKV